MSPLEVVRLACAVVGTVVVVGCLVSPLARAYWRTRR